MRHMTMRERILALVRGRPLDRVPFVMYDMLLPNDEVQQFIGRDHIGLMRWSNVHRVEHPHCRFETEEFYIDGKKWQRNIVHTPAGTILEERAFEPVYDSSSIRKHYIESAQDYEVFWSYLDDCVILEDYARFERDQAELGDDGVPLVAVERTPYQQLWVQWVGLDRLAYHFADCADHVAHTIELLTGRARRIFEIVYRSPVPFIDFPDNITAPAVGPRRFQEYCVPLYNELASMMADREIPVFVHMDGDLKPLWPLIAASQVRGIDSLSPTPDNDTGVAEAAAMWPEKRLFVNFPSSVHLRPYEQVRAEAENILHAAGHTGRLQIQISENCPLFAWHTSMRAIADAVAAFGQP
jgi:hypothetical protein